MKWRKALGLLCDKIISIRIKGKFYKRVVKSAKMYGTE